MRASRQARPLLEVVVGDGSGGDLTLHLLQPGRGARRSCGPAGGGCSPARSAEFRGKRQLNQPDYMLLDGDEDGRRGVEEFAGALIPVYPATAGGPDVA